MFKSFIKPNKPETKKSNKHIYIDDPKNDPRTNVFHLTDDYFCSGCYTILEKEKINSKTNSTFINNEEDNENLDAYYNPDMEEETKCEFCLKLSNCSIATCLVEGLPACVECAINIKNKPIDSSEPVEIEKITRLFTENPILSVSTIIEKPIKNTNRQKERDDSLSKSRSDNSSAINSETNVKKEKEKSEIEKENINIKEGEKDIPARTIAPNRKLTFRDVRMSVNFANPIETISETTREIQNVPKEVENVTNSKTKSRILPKVSLNISELNQKDFDNKIMNLVSPRTSIEFKYKRLNQGNRQFEKLCKSLEVIFNLQPGAKLSISLPVVFQGPKFSKAEKDLVDQLNKNGNYLFNFADVNSEFLFGLIWVTSDSKKLIKFFRNSAQKSLKSKNEYNLIYDDEIYEEIIIKNNLIISENDFSFSLTNYKFDLENLKVSRFLCNSYKKISIETISNLIVYDMC